jgi:hypothetical protein
MSTTNPLANFAPFILNHLADVAESNAPQTKVTPTGFLKACIEHDPSITMPEAEKLRLNTETGQIKQIRLSYLQRLKPSQTASTDTCDNDFIPVYSDFMLTAPLFRKISFLIPDETIAHYMADAAQTSEMGKPATPFMNEFMTTIKTYANGLLGAIDLDLIGQITWGVNAVTGVNTATSLNIEKDATKFDLTTGWAQLLNDLDVNEFEGTPIIVGNGIFNKFVRSRGFQGNKMNGLNDGEYADFDWYFDNHTTAPSNWGANNIGLFSKGSFGFVDLNKFVGFRAGQKGVSFFFQIELPTSVVQSDGTAAGIKFDCQLKYIDCPTTVWNGYANITANRGWQLIISKNFGLFQIPSDAYQTGDVLAGNNGSLLYAITNNT